jgi:hypothetical protein
MTAPLRETALQKGLLGFWAAWTTLVAATNLFDAMKRGGILPDGWTLSSYNFDLVADTVGAHGVPRAAAALLFGGVILWQLLAAALLWRALGALRRGRPATAAEVTQAFAVSLALWSAFLIATEATVSYATAGTHKDTLVALLATLIALRVLDGAPGAPPLRAGERAERRVA